MPFTIPLSGTRGASARTTSADAHGVYTGPFNRGLDFQGENIVVRSANGDPTTCIIDCENVDRGFQLISGEGPSAQLRDLTIRNASIDSGAGVFTPGGAPTIDNCVFENCTATVDGGEERG